MVLRHDIGLEEIEFLLTWDIVGNFMGKMVSRTHLVEWMDIGWNIFLGYTPKIHVL